MWREMQMPTAATIRPCCFMNYTWKTGRRETDTDGQTRGADLCRAQERQATMTTTTTTTHKRGVLLDSQRRHLKRSTPSPELNQLPWTPTLAAVVKRDAFDKTTTTITTMTFRPPPPPPPHRANYSSSKMCPPPTTIKCRTCINKQ